MSRTSDELGLHRPAHTECVYCGRTVEHRSTWGHPITWSADEWELAKAEHRKDCGWVGLVEAGRQGR